MKDTPVFAFPIDSDIDINRDQPWCGMTLRDYFAAKAMQPVVDNFLSSGWSFANEDLAQFIAQHCYEIADEMIKTREI
jgi:hypothetical protein